MLPNRCVIHAEQQVRVDLVITVNPVNHPLKLANLNDPLKPGIFKEEGIRPPNVDKWFNFYQRVDSLGIRGMRVIEADMEVQTTATNFQREKGGPFLMLVTNRGPVASP